MEAIESLEENMLDSAPFTLSMKDIRVDEVLVLQPEARSQNSTSESIREDKSMQERRKPGLGGCWQTGLVRSRAHGLKLSPGLPSTHTDTNHHGENGCKLKELYSSHTGSRVAGRLSWHGVWLEAGADMETPGQQEAQQVPLLLNNWPASRANAFSFFWHHHLAGTKGASQEKLGFWQVEFSAVVIWSLKEDMSMICLWVLDIWVSLGRFSVLDLHQELRNNHATCWDLCA